MNSVARPIQPYRFTHLVALLLSLTSLATLRVQSAGAPQLAPDFVAIDAYVEKERATPGIPGLALGIVHGDQIIHLQGFGLADEGGRAVTPQTSFYSGSVLTPESSHPACYRLVFSGYDVYRGLAAGRDRYPSHLSQVSSSAILQVVTAVRTGAPLNSLSSAKGILLA